MVMMSTPTEEPLEALLPAYALGALDPAERAAVEARLAADPEARRLLAEYETVAAGLVFAVPARPAPAGLQDDLRRRLAARRGEAAPRSATSRRTTTLLRLISAAAALLIVTLGLIVALRTGGALPPAQVYATLEAEGDSLRFPLVAGEVSAAVYGELIADRDGRRAVIAVSALPSLSTDQIFQLWVRRRDGEVRSGGLFQPAPEGMTYVSVPLREDESLDVLLSVGASLEPAGGSPYADRPTGPRVFAVPINRDT